ncbi:MAG: SPOR domain-containing protein [Gammaproteobacteria bacterium]
MEKTLQQRIVGAVVLVALGVILIPALLDGSGYKSRHDRNIEIPVKPLLPTLKEIKTKPVTIATPLDIKKKRIEQKKKAIPPKPIQSWALQAGTFSQKTNALAFRDSLRKEGYLAYLADSEINNQKSYRVRIGPEIEKKQLEKIKLKLMVDKKINGFIVNHP